MTTPIIDFGRVATEARTPSQARLRFANSFGAVDRAGMKRAAAWADRNSAEVREAGSRVEIFSPRFSAAPVARRGIVGATKAARADRIWRRNGRTRACCTTAKGQFNSSLPEGTTPADWCAALCRRAGKTHRCAVTARAVDVMFVVQGMWT